MASPQKEKGFTGIANEILEHLVNTALPASELRIILHILRKTYGFGKKEDVISLTQFEKATGLSRPTVVKSIKNLKIRNMIVNTALPAFRFNKDWESWVVNTALLVKNKNLTGLHRLTKTGKHRLTHKRKKKTKENMQPSVAFTNSSDYIKAMLESKHRHIRIIGLLWKFQGAKFDNAEQARSLIPRQLKSATALKPFSDELIWETMRVISHEEYITLWDLTTVLKFINQVKIERENHAKQ